MAVREPFYLDPEQSERQKRRRERHFHEIEVPRLRLLGFLILTVLVFLRQAFVHDDSAARPLLLGAIALMYSSVAWAILYAFFDKVKRVNLGTLFLSVDVVAFIVAIYLTGADKSGSFSCCSSAPPIRPT